MRSLLHPPPLLSSFSHQLKAAVWVVKLDSSDAQTQETLSEDRRVLSVRFFLHV